MKSRMMISILVIAMTAALIGGATMAWFTSQAEITGNTLAAGTLEVSLSGPAENALPLQIQNMAPGDPATVKYLFLNNDGSLPMLFRFYMDGVAAESTLQDVLKVKITLNPSDAYPRTFASDEKRQGNNNQFVWEGLLKDMIGVGKAIDNIAAAKLGYPLPAGFQDIYEVKVWLPKTVGNDFQGATFSGTLKVEATQFNNQDLDNVSWVQ